VEELGGKFWLRLVGLVFLCGIGAMIAFLLIGFAWYSWGILGSLAFLFVVLVGFGWLYDRRHARRYDDVSA
jgi:hypothetical protein